MTPNILKSSTLSPAQPNTTMDGDSTAKAMDQGANSATNADFGDAIHEAGHQATAAGQKTTGTGTSVFDKTGAVGQHFNADGMIGGMAQKVGGPLDKNGMVGKQFTDKGAFGGTAQSLADKSQGS